MPRKASEKSNGEKLLMLFQKLMLQRGKHYQNELAKWLLQHEELKGACNKFLEWGKAHGWSFIIHKGSAICGTNGKKMIMVSGGSKG